MNFQYRYVNEVVIVDIVEEDGGLVSFDIDDFINNMVELKGEKSKKIVLDMTKRNYLNSSGLSDLIRVKDSLFDRGIELILIGLSDNVRALIRMVGLEYFFKIITSEKELG